MKKKEAKEKRSSLWDKLVESAEPFTEESLPALTTIIVTHNNAHSVAITLRSLMQQNYPNLEVIVVDSGSRDRTQEVVKSYGVKLYNVSEHNVYEMFNRGSSFASGSYLNFLYPGDFYVSHSTLHFVAKLIHEKKQPDLVWGGALLRDPNREARVLYRPFTLDQLRSGEQATSLQSCWWRSDTFSVLGKLDPRYKLRGGFDLMCRFLLTEGLNQTTTTRVLCDYDRRSLTQAGIMLHFWETLPIMLRHFGLADTVRWCFHQKDLWRSFELWLHGLRIAFVGR